MPSSVALAGVEVAAEQPEPDGRLGAALGPHHAGGPRAGALRRGCRASSSTTPSSPARWRNHAHQAPMVPPPTTTASALRGDALVTLADAGID